MSDGVQLTVGSLFSGIGGFDLGLERAGFRTLWFCEQNPYCMRVLAKHWPDVPCYPDIRNVKGDSVEQVDVLCGGFPCQDLSYAGHGAGLAGARSGLWGEYARLVGELRPRYVIVENVPALLARGMGRVLGDLAALGYDAEWDCIPAAAAGAPHLRDRIWIVAYPNGAGPSGYGAQPELAGLRRSRKPSRGRDDEGVVGGPSPRWLPEPDVGRVAHGVPSRVDRLRGLGNALVPQIAEWIGERVMEYEYG